MTGSRFPTRFHPRDVGLSGCYLAGEAVGRLLLLHATCMSTSQDLLVSLMFLGATGLESSLRLSETVLLRVSMGRVDFGPINLT